MLVVSVIILLSFVNISVKNYELPTKPYSDLQSTLNNFVTHNVSHYNYKIGYVNFSLENRILAFGYFIQPFNGLNFVSVGPAYFSANANASNTLAFITFYHISLSSSSNSANAPFSVGNFSLMSPQGFNGKIETWYNIVAGTLVVMLNPPGSFVQSDPFSDALGPYPGYHTFYLNFTLTVFSTMGPYKFPSQSKNVHLEYNNTIVV